MYLLKDTTAPVTGPIVTLDPLDPTRLHRVVANCTGSFQAVIQSRHYGKRGTREANALPFGVSPPPTHNEVWINEAILTDRYPETELVLSPEMRVVVQQLHGTLSVLIPDQT